MIPGMSAMNSADENVPFLLDFSNVLDSSDSINAVVGSVSAIPDTIAVGTASIVDGLRARCGVRFTLGNGTDGQIYTVTAEIMTANGVQLARSVFVPVGGV